MPYSEDDLLPLSGLQHLAFCGRQWALIHVEQTWKENRLTAEGRVEHQRVDQMGPAGRPGVRAVCGLMIRSFRLGLSGKADVVEFHPAAALDGAVPLPGGDGLWSPFPVEHKHGRPKPNRCDMIQLCAQALCLEEMLREVPASLHDSARP